MNTLRGKHWGTLTPTEQARVRYWQAMRMAMLMNGIVVFRHTLEHMLNERGVAS